MSNADQLFTNRIRIQPETAIGVGGDNSNVYDCRLTGASIVRELKGRHERIDPWRTLEFSQNTSVSYGIGITGQLMTAGLPHWLLGLVADATGATERGMDVARISGRDRTPGTFAVQFNGIDGCSTFLGAALASLSFAVRYKSVITYQAELIALTRTTAVGAWTGTTTDAGDLQSSVHSRLALHTGAFTAVPDNFAKDCHEILIRISRNGTAAVDVSPDGVARGHSPAVWDFGGAMVIPETAGITAEAFGQDVWNGFVNLATGTDGSRFEIEAPIVARTSQRVGLAWDRKMVLVDFTSRRGAGDPIARILTTV